MINVDNFIKRLEVILDYYGLSASNLADKIGIQRSSLSHLLSGRNKPSLDFVLKVIDAYPEVDLYWLLKGKGSFPKNKESDNLIKNVKPVPSSDLFTSSLDNKTATSTETNSFVESAVSSGVIEKIVIFYKNGIFKSYISEH